MEERVGEYFLGSDFTHQKDYGQQENATEEKDCS